MATTSNYSWTTPDDTDLVKDGASAIRTLGSAIDTTVFNNAGAAVAKSTVDAKGDLIVGTANDTVGRLAVGTDGYTLVADSSTATGLAYAAPAGGEKTYTLINTGGTALTGATTITVSGLGGYSAFYVLIDSASSANALSNISIRPNAATAGVNASLSISADPTYNFSNYSAGSSTSVSNILLARMGDGAAGQIFGACHIFGGSTTGLKAYVAQGGQAYDASSDTQNIYWRQGLVNPGAEITSMAIISSTGNFDNGTVYIYGAV